MELTKEEQARIFALYLDCQMQYGDSDIEYVNGGVIDNIHDGGCDVRKLRLKDLSDISDEEILELCKIYSPTIYGDYRYDKWTIKQEGKKTEHWDTVVIERKKDDYSFQFDKIDGEILLRDKESGIDTSSVKHYYQQWFLLKGFAIPLFFGFNHWANGKTAIDLGIAERITP